MNFAEITILIMSVIFALLALGTYMEVKKSNRQRCAKIAFITDEDKEYEMALLESLFSSEFVIAVELRGELNPIYCKIANQSKNFCYLAPCDLEPMISQMIT